MTHVLEELEVYAVGALLPAQADAVARHLAECAACRAAAAEVAEVVALLAEAAPLREPPARLRARILAAAQADVPRRGLRWPLGFRGLRLAALAAAVVLLLGADVNAALRLRDAEAARDGYVAALDAVSRGGRWWYMAGVDEWAGAGGNMIAPARGGPAFVLFHDLRALPPGQVYVLWLITADGGWSRGTSFRPDEAVEVVPVGLDIAGFERCAVTVETSATGKRQGPIVMQSRIAPPVP